MSGRGAWAENLVIVPEVECTCIMMVSLVLGFFYLDLSALENIIRYNVFVK